MAKIRIDGFIGEMGEHDDDKEYKNTARDLSLLLDEHDEDEEIEMHLNSPGGDMFEGLAIMNILRDHPARVVAYIDGVAASAATLVMLGADEVVMPENAFLMIHNPWTMAIGDYQEMEKAAKNTRKFRDAVIAEYVKKTGEDEEDLKVLLDEETWLSSGEALAMGFIDRIKESEEEEELVEMIYGMDVNQFKNPPQRLVAMAAGMGRSQKRPLHRPKRGAVAMATTQKPESTQAPQIDVKQEMRDIRALCSRAKLSAEDTLAVLEQADTVNAAKDIVIDLQAKKDAFNEAPVKTQRAVMGSDERDKFKEAASDAILMRAGMKPHDRQNPFVGMKTARLAEESVRLAGGKPDFRGRENVVKQAVNMAQFGGHSTSDFPEVLKDVINKSALIGHEQAEETWPMIARTISLTDFRQGSIVGLSAFDKLDKLDENGEYKRGSISERGERIQLARYGKILQVSFKMLIDDDLSQFTEAPRLMGIMAAQIPGDLVYDVLKNNDPLNETGENLFSADHGNDGNDALDYDGLDDAATAMMEQTFTAPDGSERYLNIMPQYLIVPPALRTTALQLMNSEVVGANNQFNTFRNAYEVVTDNRLSDVPARWFLSANPNVHDALVVGFLDGNPAPRIDQKEGWDIDGLEFKISTDVAASASGFRGLQRRDST